MRCSDDVGLHFSSELNISHQGRLQNTDRLLVCLILWQDKLQWPSNICAMALPAEGDLDGRGEAGREEVSGEVRVHRQQLTGFTGCQLDAVLHGRRQRHLGKRVAGVDGCHLNPDSRVTYTQTTIFCFLQLPT